MKIFSKQLSNQNPNSLIPSLALTDQSSYLKYVINLCHNLIPDKTGKIFYIK